METLEIRSTVMEMKDALDGLNSRFEMKQSMTLRIDK